ncbi:MAG: type II toxin-antitoxin system prevent-host-death family antitoxin [Thiotrichales bacterium]|nr:type II toxin-antitoxin system prevent-host-death family antitoxin [Thiotrichales bacterium]MCY4348684.1 type II toxin-antitoxin system prevent-host-death family antitoxin [Thiotrichales bacterium]
MHITATELKNRLGRYLEAAQVEPVIVEKSGRTSSVVLSKRRYDQLCRLEDMLWDMKARNAEQEGFLSDEELRALVGQ